MDVVHINDKKWAEAAGKALELTHDFGRKRIALGILVVRPGERLPHEGLSVHENSDEFAIAIEGEFCFGTDKEERLIIRGDIVYNKRGTPHYVYNPTAKLAKIIWAVSPPL